MSKRDIETVCTLAAHLAYVTAIHLDDPTWEVKITRPASECAADAMALQRLGRSAMRALDRYSDSEAGASPGAYTGRELQERWRQIEEDADEVLRPYGLTAHCHDHPFIAECLCIGGLPDNHPNEKECGGFRI